MKAEIAALGEVMIELRPAPGSADRFDLGYAGDTFNTAIHLVRLGMPTAYVSRLGTDPYSEAILAFARREGLRTDGITQSGSDLPGLYLISNDAAGERRFDYWRGHSAARRLLQDPQCVQAVTRYLLGFETVVLSGITLAVIGLPAEAAFWSLVEQLARAGVRLVFDPNYRPRLWPDADTARSWYRRMLGCCALSFPTLDDERALFGLDSAQAVMDFHAGLGVREVVVKCPHALAWACCDGAKPASLRSAYSGPVVDTTGAGDAFNAGYLASRRRGDAPLEALAAAHALAATVVAVRGAIPPPG